jgi:hypothetical protein
MLALNLDAHLPNELGRIKDGHRAHQAPPGLITSQRLLSPVDQGLSGRKTSGGQKDQHPVRPYGEPMHLAVDAGLIDTGMRP